MAIFAVCSKCGREFPLPVSGRGRCMACIVDERRGRTRPMIPDKRERRRGPDRRVASERRAGTDRRFPDVILADRRTLSIAFRSREQRGGRTDRRASNDRRARRDRRTAQDRRVAWYTRPEGGDRT